LSDLSFLFSAALILVSQGPEEAKNPRERCPPPDSDPFSDAESGENYMSYSRQFRASANRRFEFQKRSQLFVGVHNETLSISAICIGNPDYSPVAIHSRHQPKLQSTLLRLSAMIS